MRKFLLHCAFLLLAHTAHAESFDTWKNHFQQKAIASGIPADTVYRAMANTYVDARVIKFDRKQPEGHMTLQEYVTKTATPLRVKRGKNFKQEHARILQNVQNQYGVQKEILLALWGKETDFGAYTGNFSTINSLATLAFEGRRRDFFEKELMNAIQLLRKMNWKPEQMTGSWAGAVGQCQFMPSNYLRYAIDGNIDGRVDLWSNMSDVFPSMANLLRVEGWNANQGWGQKVSIPAGFDKNLIGRDNRSQEYRFWEQRGVRFTYPVSADEARAIRLYQPDGPNTQAYAIYPNFDVLMRWNRSGYFATAVGVLSDHIKRD